MICQVREKVSFLWCDFGQFVGLRHQALAEKVLEQAYPKGSYTDLSNSASKSCRNKSESADFLGWEHPQLPALVWSSSPCVEVHGTISQGGEEPYSSRGFGNSEMMALIKQFAESKL